MKPTPSQVFLGCILAGGVASTSLTETANYEDITRGLTNKPIGTYKDLTYFSWFISTATASTVPVKVGGVAPQSPPNDINTNAMLQLTSGTPSMIPASPYTSFGLLDFYFGCGSATQEGTANAALQCTITVAGFQPKTNKEIALASFTFTPPLSPVAPVPMIHAVLPSGFWQGLGNVTIIQDNELAAILLDILHYTVTK